MYKQNWFETLNAALESENLIDLWECGLNVGYGENIRHYAQDGKKIRLISVYRNTNGLYERPIHYLTS